jgi:hypothetical protein
MKNKNTQLEIDCTVAEIEDQINEMFFDEVNITKKIVSELIKVCWGLNDSFNEVSEVTYKHVKEIKKRIKNGGNTEEVFNMLEKELKELV